MLPFNVLFDTDRLYDQDRSDIIWEAEHFAAFAKEASVEVQEAVDLAAATGLRRGDLVRLPWSAIGEHAIVWHTGKSRGRTLVTVPILPETKAIFARIKARHAVEMAAKRKDKRKPLPDTVLSNSYWRPWTAMGLGSRFRDARDAAGITVHLHDLRGTFATRCMIAGLTDQEIADILGWSTKDVAKIRAKYVSQHRVVVEIGKQNRSRKIGGSVKRL
ncbi:tyrosine-type recombinase/integrase [Sphingomonas hankookensis]|uniref:tyrosine-type recombinase/integrase n=1 Tax=Sphingomonas hankookensis TaxID=563996 RepID=UPI003F78D927